MTFNCDTCTYYIYDEDDEAYYCDMDMDEDDAVRQMTQTHTQCPYYRNNYEYEVVRHQM